jgi:hypothetical protein
MSNYKKSWAEFLATIHDEAKKEGFSPRYYARHLVAEGKDTFPVMLDLDATGAFLDLTPDCREYIALEGWFAKQFAEDSEVAFSSLLKLFRGAKKRQREALDANRKKGTGGTQNRAKMFHDGLPWSFALFSDILPLRH